MTTPRLVFFSLLIAGAHFVACGILAAVVLPASLGYKVSEIACLAVAITLM